MDAVDFLRKLDDRKTGELVQALQRSVRDLHIRRGDLQAAFFDSQRDVRAAQHAVDENDTAENQEGVRKAQVIHDAAATALERLLSEMGAGDQAAEELHDVQKFEQHASRLRTQILELEEGIAAAKDEYGPNPSEDDQFEIDGLQEDLHRAKGHITYVEGDVEFARGKLRRTLEKIRDFNARP